MVYGASKSKARKKPVGKVPPYQKQKTGGLFSKNYHPFMGVQYEYLRTFTGHGTFRIFTYQAYNALGLIGPEFNGVSVCDDDNHKVICAEIERENSGYFGVSQAQYDKWHWLAYTATWEEFRDFVNAQPRCRIKL